MKSDVRSWNGAFLAVLLMTCAALAQTGFSIRGKITDQNRLPIAGARVRVTNREGVELRSATTDTAGEFEIAGLNAGRYMILIDATGFATETVESAGQSPLEISLAPAHVAEVVSITSSYLAGSDDALRQTPGSIGVIDRRQLENARVSDSSEALRRVAGVNTRDEEGLGLRPNIAIRGTNPTRSTKVLLLEDGIPLAYAPYGDNASYYHPPIDRFESIEVQKGSGQIEFGPVTVAGLVNYITPNPTDRPTLNLKLSGGNRSLFNGNAQFGGTWGKTGLILNLNRKQGQGSRENLRSGLTDVSTKIVQTLTDRQVLTGKFSVFAEDSRVTYSGLTLAEFIADPRQNPFRNDSFTGRRYGASLQHVLVLNGSAELTTSVYHNYFSRDWWRQSSNSGQRPNRLNIDPDCRSMADLLTTCGNEGRLRDYRTWGIEPKLSMRFDLGSVRYDLATGFRYVSENQDRRQLNGDLPDSRDGALVESNVRRNRALSGFAQNRFIYGDLAITAGLRIEKIDYRRLNRLNQASGSTSITELIPGIGIAYNVAGSTTVFAGIHRGFAPPRTEDIISNTGGVVEIDAEKSWNYEAGIRTRPTDGLSLEATLFRTDYSNQVVPASVAGGVGSVFTNGGRTLHQGIEIAGRADSAPLFKSRFNLYFQSSVTFLSEARFEFDRFSSVGGFGTVSVSGNRLPYAPRATVNATLGYNWRDFDGFIESNYISRQFSDDLNTVNSIPNGQRGAIQAQTYFNATANYRLEKLKSVIFVTVKNILDRTFIVDRSRGILPSSPRSVQTGIKISF